MQKLTGLDLKIKEMSERIRELREITKFTPEEMASKTDVSVEEYLKCENGDSDLNFAFIYRCAQAFGVDVTDIIEGVSPTLRSYVVTRNGQGQMIEHAHGMVYYSLASAFQNRIADPLYVKCDYNAEAENREIELTTHDGQEMDIVISGHLMVQVGTHTEVLNPGDTIYYDSGTPHGMRAALGEDCVFYAIVLNPSGEPIPELSRAQKPIVSIIKAKEDKKERIYKKYIDVVKNENGTPVKITFKNHDRFNFAFDIMDEIAKKDPDKLAMLHVSREKEERRFTFNDVRHLSNQCANYFKSIGIKRGDRVILILKRHYQFWMAMLGLMKIGAIGIPAVAQLQAHDIEYRLVSSGA